MCVRHNRCVPAFCFGPPEKWAMKVRSLKVGAGRGGEGRGKVEIWFSNETFAHTYNGTRVIPHADGSHSARKVSHFARKVSRLLVFRS